MEIATACTKPRNDNKIILNFAFCILHLNYERKTNHIFSAKWLG